MNDNVTNHEDDLTMLNVSPYVKRFDFRVSGKPNSSYVSKSNRHAIDRHCFRASIVRA